MSADKKPLVIIVFFFLSLFVYTKLAGPITFSVNNVNTENTTPFQTTGTGEVTGVPSQATVSLGVTATSNSSDQAKASANNVVNKVTSDLKALGIDGNKIKTTNFSVTPNGPGSIQPLIAPLNSGTGAYGYTANATIEIDTPTVDLANKAIDVASKDGANQLGGVNFTFDDATKNKLMQQAQAKAIADAKQKAQSLADAAGIKLGRIINISEDDNGGPIMFAANAKGAAPAPDQTQLNPGENTVSATVTLTFETN